MYSIEEIKIDIEEELASWDCPITKDNIIRVATTWIDNLYSHIGKEAHEHEAQFVVDKTGMSWEEQDAQTLELIDDYRRFLDSLKE